MNFYKIDNYNIPPKTNYQHKEIKKNNLLSYTTPSKHQKSTLKGDHFIKKTKVAGLAGLAGLLLAATTAFNSNNIKKNKENNEPNPITYSQNPSNDDTLNISSLSQKFSPKFISLLENWHSYLNKNNFKINQNDLVDLGKALEKLNGKYPLKNISLYDLNQNGKFENGEFLIIKDKDNNEHLILNQTSNEIKDYTNNFNLTDDNKIGIKLKDNKTEKKENFGNYLIEKRRPFPTISKQDKSYEGFLNNLAFSESTYRNDIQLGSYMGWFQMGEMALNDIGYRINSKKEQFKNCTKITKKEFINDKDLQIELIKKRINTSVKRIKNANLDKKIGCEYNIEIPVSILNAKDIKRLKKDNDGQFIEKKGIKYFSTTVKITESGMIAGAHLCGDSAVKKFILNKGKNADTIKDGNNVFIHEYIKKFADYDIPGLTKDKN